MCSWAGQTAAGKGNFGTTGEFEMDWLFDDMKEFLGVIKLGSRMFLFVEMQTQVFQGRNL